MIESLILIEGNVKEDHLRISLGNAKQLVIGRVPADGWILHVAATSAADLGKALLEFGEVEGVKSVSTLTLRNT